MDEFSASQSQKHDQGAVHSVLLDQSANFQVEETRVNRRRLWVGLGPKRNPVNTLSVKKRLVQAINCLKHSIRDKDVLIQIWIPVKIQGRQVLTTNNQPFSLNPNCKNLAHYRDVCQNYHFVADGESTDQFVGLPGRVFLNKLPEWTPDVRFFRRDEYPRVRHAQQYDVRGSLALPVFQQGSGICLGVVEIVTTCQKVNFHTEFESVCKALEAVDLRSFNHLSPYNIAAGSDQSCQVTLTEIKNIFKLVCNAHKLPLAQVWASCLQQRKGGCRHSDENYARCVSTIELACYVADAQVTGFHQACSQHHLLKGEGVPGKAFLTNQSCFAHDITAFTKTEYPLAHHARMFDLCASAAIQLRSTYNGTADFVLEFFLPSNCKGPEDQMLILHSLSSVIQQTCQSLRVITDQEWAQFAEREKGTTSAGGKHTKLPISLSKESSHKGKGIFVSLADHERETNGELNNSESDLLHRVPASLEHYQLQQDSVHKTSSEKKQKKTDKAISLPVLRQYFAGSLKEAAKSIGVCPTTLKRICRQHGISRWPSRKIKKVGHSLKKLQLVMDSVQGADGSIRLNSFYNNFQEIVSPKVPRAGSSGKLLTPNMTGYLQQVNSQTDATTAPKSPSSSGGNSSSSTYHCSTGEKQSSLPVKITSSIGDALSAEQTTGGILKRAQTKLLSDCTPIGDPAVPEKSNQRAHHVGTFRVKATFGEQNIRLNLHLHWGFKDLWEEILRRFDIDNGSSSVNLKYLDDDAEWVLLTCDDDLEECLCIHSSTKSRAIKLSVNQGGSSSKI